jgi:ferredoxin
MEGPGPASGTPRHVGAILAGTDLAAIDTVAAHIIHLQPARVPLLVAAQKHQFGETDIAKIDLAGDDWHSLHVPDFKNVGQLVDLLRLLPLPRGLLLWMRRQWMERPRIIEERCIHCRACEKGCPVKPAAIRPNLSPRDQVDDDRCIGCYCCHEFCPCKAIHLSKPLLARLLPLTAIANGVSRILGFVASLFTRH